MAVIPPTQYDIAKDFITPVSLTLITLIVSYFISKIHDSRQKNEELNSKKVGFIDSLLIDIDRLNIIFDDLQKDPDEQQFFKFKNINTAKPSIERLQKVFGDAIVFPDDNLRKRVLTDIDLVSSLIEDLSNLENYATTEANKFIYVENELMKELRLLKLELLKMDIKLDNKVTSLNPSVKISEEKKQEIMGMSNILNGQYTQAKQQRDNMVTFCKDKRTYYTMQIIAAQTRLRELEQQLNTMRDKLVKRKFFFW